MIFAIIDENITLLEELAKQKGIKIHKKIINQDIIINDELLLILVTNLLKNAVTYTTSKSVNIDSEIVNNEFVLIVKNKGEIPAIDLDNIFDSFFRSSNSFQEKNGTGLGLFIVKQICDIYNYNYKIFNDNGFVTAKINIKIKK